MPQINVEKILEFQMPRWNDLPTIDIYLDQLVTYLDQNLKIYSAGNPTIITKTMINNCAEHDFPYPPDYPIYPVGAIYPPAINPDYL